MRHAIGLCIFLAPSLVLAQIPTFVSFEAAVTDPDGQPVTGFHAIDVEVFDSLSGGGSLGVVFGASVELDADGYLSVPLSFNGVDLAGGDLFVELSIDSETVLPRFAMGSVPYALMTTAVADGSVGANQIASGAIDTTHIATGLGLVPSGGIIMWSGSVGTIPSGWALCDGTQATPNLSNRFVRGSATPGTTGGTDTYSLTESQLPAHQHGFTTDTDGVHFHGMEKSITGVNNSNSGPSQLAGGSNAPDEHARTADAGSHSHSGTTSAIGSDAAIDNRPAYYELAFIMKL